jgi:hypothetical protein
MVNTSTKKDFGIQRKHVVQQVAKLRKEIESLTDYLDLLEARAKNLGTPRLRTADVKRRLGLK